MSNNTGYYNKDGKLYYNGVEVIGGGGGGVHNTFNKICVYGTSIEVTPSTNFSWPACMAQALGLTYGTGVVNHGKGGGGVTWYGNDVLITDVITAYKSHVLAGFSCTTTEKQAAADYFLGEGLITQAEIDAAKSGADWNLAYDKSLLEEEDVDLYIFGTYGINDRSINQWMQWTDDNGNTQNSFTCYSHPTNDDWTFDRRTIFGAYNYVLRALYQQNPNAKVVILGQHSYNWEYQDIINAIQQAVAEKWQIPFADWGNHIHLTDLWKSATFQHMSWNDQNYKQSIFQDDGAHLQKYGAQLLGKWVADWITNTELKPLNPRWGLE